MTSTERRRHNRRYKQTRFKVIVCGLIIIFGTLIIGELNDVMMMSTDTLNKLNDVSIEVDELKQSIDTGQKNGSTVKSEAHSILSDADRSLIERVVMSESGNQPLEAQMAVAQTLYDRMNDFGETLDEAVSVCSTADNGEPTDSVKLAVSNVFDNGARIYDGGTYQFHDDSVTPYWTANKIKRGSIGRLTFYGGTK